MTIPSTFPQMLVYSGPDEDGVFCSTTKVDRANDIDWACKNLCQHPAFRTMAEKAGLNPNNLYIEVEIKSDGTPSSLFIGDPEGRRDGISIPITESDDRFIYETANYIIDGQATAPSTLPLFQSMQIAPLPPKSKESSALTKPITTPLALPVPQSTQQTPLPPQSEESKALTPPPPTAQPTSPNEPSSEQLRPILDELRAQNELLHRLINQPSSASSSFTQPNPASQRELTPLTDNHQTPEDTNAPSSRDYKKLEELCRSLNTERDELKAELTNLVGHTRKELTALKEENLALHQKIREWNKWWVETAPKINAIVSENAALNCNIGKQQTQSNLKKRN